MGKQRLAEGSPVIIRHVGQGVFGTREMPGIYIGRETERFENVPSLGTVVHTRLFVEAYPQPGTRRLMEFAADDNLSVHPHREWKLVQGGSPRG